MLRSFNFIFFFLRNVPKPYYVPHQLLCALWEKGLNSKTKSGCYASLSSNCLFRSENIPSPWQNESSRLTFPDQGRTLANVAYLFVACSSWALIGATINGILWEAEAPWALGMVSRIKQF